jgi:hypothetical protein
MVAAVVSLLLGLSWAGAQFGWGSPQVVGALALSVLATALFIIVERRAKNPIMPMEIYSNRIVSLSFIAVLVIGFGMFGGIVFIPLYLQGVLGASATSSGSFLTPMMLGVVVGSALSGQALSRLGGHYRWQGVLGLIIMLIGLVMLSRLTVDSSYGSAIYDIVVLGLGLGITFPAFTIAVQNSVPYRLLGVATSGTQFYRSIGGAMGLAVLGSLMASRFSSGLAASLSPAVREAIPPEQLAALRDNPQALMNPDALRSLSDSLGQIGTGGAEIAQQLLEATRLALASAIGDVFLVATAAVAVGLVVSLFLKELPLQGR